MYNIVLWYFINYEIIITVILVTISHHAKLPDIIDYIPYVYITSPWLIYFIAGTLYLLIPSNLFCLSPTPSGNHQFILHLSKSVSALFVHLFSFLDST